jgi:hypothetical protein
MEIQGEGKFGQAAAVVGEALTLVAITVFSNTQDTTHCVI